MTNEGALAAEATDLLQHLIRNQCVNDGTPESGHEDRSAETLRAYLGETGTAVFLRLSSFILLCVGVAIIWSGVVDLVQPLIGR